MSIAKIFTNHYEQSHDSNCTKYTRIIWEYYTDNNGIMITYPYYRGNPIAMYEHDQCTDNKILYDPRIKPVSSYI